MQHNNVKYDGRGSKRIELYHYHTKEKVLKEHVQAARYESDNKEVTAVTNDGKIKAVKKGNCIIYIYGQNGVSHKVKVTVK